jgi:hypothetical protein
VRLHKDNFAGEPKNPVAVQGIPDQGVFVIDNLGFPIQHRHPNEK